MNGGIRPKDEAALAEERHRSEVRMLLRMHRMSGWDAVVRFLDGPALKGRAAALRRDVRAQFRAGNDGTEGKWL